MTIADTISRDDKTRASLLPPHGSTVRADRMLWNSGMLISRVSMTSSPSAEIPLRQDGTRSDPQAATDYRGEHKPHTVLSQQRHDIT